MMRITYDKQADMMYIRFNDLPSDGTETVNGYVNLDTTEDGTLVGIELFAVSKFAHNLDAIIEQYDIHKVRAAEAMARESAK